MITEKTLIDLEADETFFDDLKKGNFILVLGAGFSYGIPNKAGGTIPIGDDFARITKKRFRDPSSVDYRSAAQVWRTEIRNKPSIIDEFKNHFFVDESKFDFKLYSSIFIPKWHNIFTLNFDDVLEMAQKSSPYKELTTYAYPKTSGNSDPNILHLHGLIDNENSLENLVFTPESYLEFDTKLNTLYNVLHGDVRTLNKKILILGSQFKEDIILRKFFSELPFDKSVSIYHFDIENYNKNSDNFTVRNSTFVKLLNKKGDKGTKVFLQFLLDNKHKIRTIELPGAITINKGFEETIQNGKSFSRSQFYSAKQEDNCQWYGVLNKYDIVRKDYPKIKDAVLKAFTSTTTSKVVAIIHGTGGCGKSTLLRRLALQLMNESDFEIIWVKDRQLENFILYALPKIELDHENNYLVFVEDWYRLVGNNTAIGANFLKATESIKNIRLVIGDREINQKDYLFYLLNKNNRFELTSNENNDIIQQIIENHIDWKEASESILIENPHFFKSPLFIILFAIVGVSENRIFNNENELMDLENIVKRIARFDLRNIFDINPGFAKALHYWSCIYAEQKIFITYNTFLQIADYYNGNNDVSTCFNNWERNNDVLDKLKLYINVSPNETLAERFRSVKEQFETIQLIQFNHDILADILSEVELKGWESYDDIQKKKLLNIIIENGDDYSASILLNIFLSYDSQLFQDDKERKTYIDKLFFQKKNRMFQYINFLTKLDLTPVELYKYIEILREEGLYHQNLWSKYFRIADAIERKVGALTILAHPEFYKLPHQIVVTALNILKDDEEGINAAICILNDPDYSKFTHQIVATAKNVVISNGIWKTKWSHA